VLVGRGRTAAGAAVGTAAHGTKMRTHTKRGKQQASNRQATDKQEPGDRMGKWQKESAKNEKESNRLPPPAAIQYPAAADNTTFPWQFTESSRGSNPRPPD
jgi:hypothetical protein